MTGDPNIPTQAQTDKLGELMRARTDSNVSIAREPFDLPPGYIVATFQNGGFTVGISPEGEGSS